MLANLFSHCRLKFQLTGSEFVTTGRLHKYIDCIRIGRLLYEFFLNIQFIIDPRKCNAQTAPSATVLYIKVLLVGKAMISAVKCK